MRFFAAPGDLLEGRDRLDGGGRERFRGLAGYSDASRGLNLHTVDPPRSGEAECRQGVRDGARRRANPPETAVSARSHGQPKALESKSRDLGR
eukprot:15039-Pelagococcus_subviridis.AAC.1